MMRRPPTTAVCCSTALDATSYQWQVSANGATGWADASGAGNATSSYTIAAADFGKYLRIEETASKADYADDAEDSAATGPVAAGALPPTTAPSLSGSAKGAATLTATDGSSSPAPDAISYQWQ